MRIKDMEQELRKEMHSFADRFADMLLNSYEKMFNLPGVELTEEQRASIIGDALKVVTASMLQSISGMSEQLDNVVNDPAKMTEIIDNIKKTGGFNVK